MNKLLSVLGQVLIIFIQEIVTGLYRFIFRIKRSPKKISAQLALVTGTLLIYILIKTISAFISFFIQGGARGLGKAIATRLAQEGCNIAICDINIEEAQRTSKELKSKFNISCEAFKADVSDTQQVATLYNEILEKMGTVDILVCAHMTFLF